MKKFIICIVLLTSAAFAQRDPWENYDGNNGNHNGHHHPHPHYPVPEPSTYGAIFIAVSISFLLIRRKMKK